MTTKPPQRWPMPWDSNGWPEKKITTEPEPPPKRKRERKVEPWEINAFYVWVWANGCLHIADHLAHQTPGTGEYGAQAACGYVGKFGFIEQSTGYYVRTSLKHRRCRKCVAEIIRRAAGGVPLSP